MHFSFCNPRYFIEVKVQPIYMLQVNSLGRVIHREEKYKRRCSPEGSTALFLRSILRSHDQFDHSFVGLIVQCRYTTYRTHTSSHLIYLVVLDERKRQLIYYA